MLPKLADDGFIVADNVLWSGRVADPSNEDANTVNIREFNDHVLADERVECVMLTRPGRDAADPRPTASRRELRRASRARVGQAERLGIGRELAVRDGDHRIPAACAERMPLWESSIAAHRSDATPRRRAASR